MNIVVILTLVFKSTQCVCVLTGLQVPWPAASLSLYSLHPPLSSFLARLEWPISLETFPGNLCSEFGALVRCFYALNLPET